jgi:hypothetical protein
MRNDHENTDQVNKYLTWLAGHENNGNDETMITNDDGKGDPILLTRYEENGNGETTIRNDDKMRDQVDGHLT